MHPTLKRLLHPIVRATRARRGVAVLMMAAASAWSACNGDKAAVRCSTVSFQSMGQPVPARLCLPEGNAASLPAVVYLHAVDGPQEVPGGLFAELVKRGFAVFEIHYFALTPSPGPNTKSFLQVYLKGQDEVYAEAARLWPRVITDGVAFLREQQRIDGARVGVVGYSLGAAMALATADTHNDYRAIATLAGFTVLDGFPRLTRRLGEAFAPNVATFPRALILHGDSDRAIPASEAAEIRDMLQAAGRSPELYISEGGDHFWKGKRGEDARGRIVEFFNRHLAR